MVIWLTIENSPVTGEFLSQRPVTRGFDVFFDLRLNKRLSKQPGRRGFEAPSHHYYVTVMHDDLGTHKNVAEGKLLTRGNETLRLKLTPRFELIETGYHEYISSVTQEYMKRQTGNGSRKELCKKTRSLDVLFHVRIFIDICTLLHSGRKDLGMCLLASCYTW